MQTFIKTVNYSHLMPTRYNLMDVNLGNLVGPDALENSEAKKSANIVRSLCPTPVSVSRALLCSGGLANLVGRVWVAPRVLV